MRGDALRECVAVLIVASIPTTGRATAATAPGCPAIALIPNIVELGLKGVQLVFEGSDMPVVRIGTRGRACVGTWCQLRSIARLKRERMTKT